MSREKQMFKREDLEKQKLLTRQEAAEYCRVGLSTIDKYRRTVWKNFVVAQGFTGGRIFFQREMIDKWLENGGVRMWPYER